MVYIEKLFWSFFRIPVKTSVKKSIFSAKAGLSYCCFCDKFEAFFGVTSFQKNSGRLLLQLSIFWTNDFRSCRPEQIAHSMPIERARARKISETCPVFRAARAFCLAKKKKPLDLQSFSRIGKTMKKLWWVPNTIMNTTLFW